MSAQARWDEGPTTYAEANKLLQVLLADLPCILGDQLIGIYLRGSLASGDFDPRSSDIDFLVVTAGEVSDDKVQVLAGMHRRLVASGLPWVTRLEGSYIPRHALRRHDPSRSRFPALSVGGSFGLDDHGSDWVIQRYSILHAARVLVGPDPAGLIDPVSPDELRQAARETLREWWVPQLQDTSRLRSREYQGYAVLTMCRALYTLQFGDVASKPLAARWAMATLDGRWVPVIRRALDWPEEPEADRLAESLEFIRAALLAAGVFNGQGALDGRGAGSDVLPTATSETVEMGGA